MKIIAKTSEKHGVPIRFERKPSNHASKMTVKEAKDSLANIDHARRTFLNGEKSGYLRERRRALVRRIAKGAEA